MPDVADLIPAGEGTALRTGPSASHPALAPFARWIAACPAAALPDHDLLNGWARESGLALDDGRPLAFVAPPKTGLSALAYEQHIARHAEIVTRSGSRHDVWNALAWLAFPRTKATLNAIHVAAGRAGTANARDRRRDAATLLDESGIVVACTDPALVALWRAHRWREAFWDRRAANEGRLRVAAIGHGLLAKLAAPYRSITAKAMLVGPDVVAVDAATDGGFAALDWAAAVTLSRDGMAFAPASLLPLPVAALPGWDTEALGERLFDDASVFRGGVPG